MGIFKNLMAKTFLFSVMLMMAIFWCCGNQAQAATEGDYTYTITNGKAEITKYTGTGGSVTIPGTLGGAAVTSVGPGVFYLCKDLITHVSIPDSVTDIGDYTFAACDGLTSVSIPDSVISIGNYAFEGCTGLTSITLPVNLTSMGRFSFNYCEGLTSISIPESVTSIGVGAFRGCTGLAIITFNSSITTFEKETLAELDEATSDTCTIPNTTKIMGYDPSTAKDYAVKYNRTFEVIYLTESIPDKVVTPPELDYDKINNANEQQVISVLDDSYKKLSDAQKNDADSIEAITKYSEFGISQILKSQAAVTNGQIAIDKNTLASQEAKASATKTKIEQEMAKYKIALNRDIQTEILLQSPQWIEQAVSVVADKNLSEPSSKIDSIRIEGQEAGVVFNVAALKEELAASGTLTVQIEKENNTTASSGRLLASLDNNTPYVAFKLNLPSFKVSLNNGLQKLKNNIKIILPKATGDTDYQAVFKADGDSSEAIGGKYNQASDRIEIPIQESGRYYVADNQKDFSDIQNKPEEVQKAIKVLASKGIIKGRSESSFDPNASISRSEIAALMVKTLYKLDKNAAAGFSDVPSSAWYYSYAASAKNHNIVNGYPDNTFRGGIVINKEQITAVCARTMREEKHYQQPSNIETYLKYTDKNSISDWAKGDVSLASREGLVVKRQDGNFLGSQGMTRADAALVLYRLFNRL